MRRSFNYCSWLATSAALMMSANVMAGVLSGGVSLVDGANGQMISGYNPIAAGAVINLSKLPTQDISIFANNSSKSLGKVVFNFDGSYSHTEHDFPYDMCGDSGLKSYVGCSQLLKVGNHQLSVKAYDSRGNLLDSVSLAFSVAASVAPSPVPSPSAKPSPQPSPKPSPSPVPSPVAGSGQDIPYKWDSCTWDFPYYNTRIDGQPIDPNSAKYINSVATHEYSYDGKSYNGDTVYLANLEYLNDTDAADSTMIAMGAKKTYHPFDWLFPAPARNPGPTGEGGLTGQGDSAMIIINHNADGSCESYQFGDVTYSAGSSGPGSYSAWTGGRYPSVMPADYFPYKDPAGGQGPTGVGNLELSVKAEELAAGFVPHAIEWGAASCSVSPDTYVYPAKAGEGACAQGAAPLAPRDNEYGLPYGAKLRLKPNAPCYLAAKAAGSKGDLAVLTAMQNYGIVMVNTAGGNNLLGANAVGVRYPSSSAEFNSVGKYLGQCHLGTDFDVMPLGQIMHN